jgi:hypothetical protein
MTGANSEAADTQTTVATRADAPSRAAHTARLQLKTGVPSASTGTQFSDHGGGIQRIGEQRERHG